MATPSFDVLMAQIAEERRDLGKCRALAAEFLTALRDAEATLTYSGAWGYSGHDFKTPTDRALAILRSAIAKAAV